ncbi:MAG: hypothetical protein AUI15_04350 [Actinobacteria bacterium 13_2_20CM_2_66_6]|nr:MAG: hypothetical protein AUI15_04350 [Actinobacteria bacterium 13_2_20CM_2_66_6]
MNPTTFVDIAVEGYFVVVALLFGSFINLAADRLPRGESLLRPRSHCRPCGRQLNLLDLVPVGGYLLRRGRCAGCGAPIGMSSLAVEGACGMVMMVPLLWLGVGGGFLLGSALVLAVGVVAVGLALGQRRPEEL